jgi:copper(I)-binding protein
MRRTVLFGLVALAVAGSAWARDFTLGGLTIGHPWSRPAPQGGTGAGFLTVTNHGTKADTLVAISTPVAARAEIHESMEIGRAHV